MANTLHLTLAGEPITFPVERVIIAGFTGRDSEKLRQHIDELAAHGVAAPPTVPAFYSADAQLISTGRNFQIDVSTASGEAEAVLLMPSESLDDALVAVGSDITDRAMERKSIQKSKQLVKPIGSAVWRLRDLRDSWDELQLTSWAERDRKNCYQQGTLAALLPPDQIIAKLRNQAAELANTALFLGTIPLCQPQFAFTGYFACELRARRGHALACEYDLKLPS